MQKTLLGLLSIFLVLLVSGFAVADGFVATTESDTDTVSDGPTGSFESDDTETTPVDETSPTTEPTFTTDGTEGVTPISDETTPTTELILTTDDTPVVPTGDESSPVNPEPTLTTDSGSDVTPTDETTPVTPAPTLTTADSPEVANPEIENPTPGFSITSLISALFNPTTDEPTETVIVAEPASTDVPSGSGDDEEDVCEFTCTEWSACSLDGTQTRTCTGSDQCSILDDAPATSQSCSLVELSQPTSEVTTTETADQNEATADSEQSGFFSRITGAVIGSNGRPTGLGVAAVFILVIVIAYFVVKFR